MPEQKPEKSAAEITKDIANSAKTVGKAAAKGAHGDLIGAGLEIIRNPKVVKGIIAIILSIVLLLLAPFMLIGSAIIGTIDKLASEFQEAWDKNLEEMGASSNGNALYLYAWGYPIAGIESAVDAVVNSIKDLFTLIHFWGDEDASNSSLGTADGKAEITEDDYKNTIKSLTDTDALTLSLSKRLDMIKGRVEQRGEQIYDKAISTYSLESMGEAIAANLLEEYKNPFLYGGINSINVNIDKLAFTLSDLQALKIYAAYSIQHDVVIEDADMWDLMDYCGWYGTSGNADIETLNGHSIYNGKVSATFASEIGGVVNTGDTISSIKINLFPPEVPKWKGTFAPQWYYEEQRQIRELQRKEPGRFATNEDGEIDFSRFTRLNDFQPYGIIDKLYTASDASLTIDRTEYEDATVALKNNIIETLTSSALKTQWGQVGEKEETTYLGNIVSKSDNLIHSVTVVTTESDCNYYLRNISNGDETAWQYCNEDGEHLVFTDLEANTTYTIFKVVKEYSEINPPVIPENSEPEWEIDPDGNLIIKPHKPKPKPQQDPEPFYAHYAIENVHTFPETPELKAYKLDLTLNVVFSSKSIDSMLYDVLGLWKGPLTKTETENGIEYAAGQKGNPLLMKTWTDTYTDPDGNEQTITFERQQGSQVEAYEDIVYSVAEILNINVTGMGTPHAGYGDTIVEVAMKELEYYKANSLSGGERYWNMATEAGGNGIGGSGNTPWCACFVMTCAWQCGYVGEGQAWGAMGGSNWPFVTGNLASALVDNGRGQVYETRDYRPVPGDLIFFDSEGPGNTDMSDHIGIVASVNADDSISVIHGNWDNSLTITHADNYAVGSTFVNTFITSYVHPNYPAITILEPVYMNIPSEVIPTITAKNIKETMLIGVGRARMSQCGKIVEELKSKYPEFYSDVLQAAVDANDENAFTQEWNKLFAIGDSSDIKRIQQAIYSKLFIAPVSKEIKAATGFDWQKDTVRSEILWGLATTTEQTSVLVELLTELSYYLDPNISELDFLNAMKTDDKLYNLVEEYKGRLWVNDTDQLKNAWLKSIELLIAELAEIWEERNAQFGDPNAPIEDQVYFYLTRTIGFTPAAASGVMANIQEESGFDPTIYGDYGTSYGLCQWHNSRFTALRTFCSERNLDFTTVQGQMEYLQFELTTQYAGMVSRFRTTPNTADGAYDAAYDWCVNFEVPANKEAKGRERGEVARSHYWPNYGSRS